ncbi:MAG TPA: hypothetical protein VFH48_10215 [Chloroflexota bacterium]|nr:hypothetical protein [Chloroflexota bacterium]
MAVTDRCDKFHQLDDHLMPGQIGQTAADVRDGGIELLTTQRVEQIRVRGRHPARQDIQILVPAPHLYSIYHLNLLSSRIGHEDCRQPSDGRGPKPGLVVTSGVMSRPACRSPSPSARCLWQGSTKICGAHG